MSLTNRRKVFIEEYLQCWNATEAARRAGYAHPNKRGPELVVNRGIAEEIKRRISEIVMSADEVLIRLAEQARGEQGRYITEDGRVDIEQLVADGKAYLIKAIRPGKYGNVIEFYDAQSALVQIGRHFGLFKESMDMTTFDIDVATLTNDQLERIANGEDPLRVLASARQGGTGEAEAGTGQ